LYMGTAKGRGAKNAVGQRVGIVNDKLRMGERLRQKLASIKGGSGTSYLTSTWRAKFTDNPRQWGTINRKEFWGKGGKGRKIGSAFKGESQVAW